MKKPQWLDYAAALNFEFLSGANVTIYPDSHELFVSGTSVRCSRTHFRLMHKLISNFCKTVRYENLLGIEDRELQPREQNLLKVQMFYLRRLLDRHGAQLEIRNIYGTGYQARPRA
ncbi:MAG: winged helix-turn-helix domain-containing protein [Candidatus Eremiobacteraeota bacterium]|nr:winged helix-turn-helix domain-containing protein [Candidatus Eremiobacteraeota bacterium]